MSEEEDKKTLCMNVIYKALEDGWSVKKSDIGSKTFEFTKNGMINNDYKGLVVIGKNYNIMDDINNHLEQLRRCDIKRYESKRSISVPVKKNETFN